MLTVSLMLLRWRRLEDVSATTRIATADETSAMGTSSDQDAEPTCIAGAATALSRIADDSVGSRFSGRSRLR